MLLVFLVILRDIIRWLLRGKLWDPTEKGIVITGASSGIGAETARQYAAKGARLVICARRDEELQKVAEQCRALGAKRVCPIVADMSNPEDCRSFIKQAAEELDGTIDCLLLNAGVSMCQRLEDMADTSIIRQLMETNFFGYVECTHAAIPYLKRSTAPKIVVISSGSGFLPFSHRTGYCASKFALHGFFDSLRIELRPYKAQVTLICPSLVQTDINRTRAQGAQYELDMTKGMPVQNAAREIVEAVAKGKRIHVLTFSAKLARYLEVFFPEIVERLGQREMDRMQKPKIQ
jgi:short-subunit dehydrogenase